jgi:hypothetical protein
MRLFQQPATDLRFGFERHIGAMIQRAFVDFCRGFEFSLDQSHRQAAFLTVDKGSALSFDNFGDQELCAMTSGAFIGFYFGFKLALDQNEVETAFFTINQGGTFPLVHLSSPVFSYFQLCALLYLVSSRRASFERQKKQQFLSEITSRQYGLATET